MSRSLHSFHSVGMTYREDALPLPMGEVAERKRGRRGSTLTIPIRYHSKNTVRPSQSRLRRASSPIGRAKGRGRFRLSTRVTFGTFHGGAPRSESKSSDCRGQSHLDSIDESSPLHCVVPFIHTSSIRNMEGSSYAAVDSTQKIPPCCLQFVVVCVMLSAVPPAPRQAVPRIFSGVIHFFLPPFI